MDNYFILKTVGIKKRNRFTVISGTQLIGRCKLITYLSIGFVKNKNIFF